MYRVDFPAIGSGRGLTFDWDPDTGTLSGPDAHQVQMAIEHARKEGTVTSHPWPTPYPIRDPLHSLPEMAAVISQFCRLDEEWQTALDSIAPEDDGSEGEFQVIH